MRAVPIIPVSQCYSKGFLKIQSSDILEMRGETHLVHSLWKHAVCISTIDTILSLLIKDQSVVVA